MNTVVSTTVCIGIRFFQQKFSREFEKPSSARENILFFDSSWFNHAIYCKFWKNERRAYLFQAQRGNKEEYFDNKAKRNWRLQVELIIDGAIFGTRLDSTSFIVEKRLKQILDKFRLCFVSSRVYESFSL